MGDKRFKITVVGSGYVGMSLSVLLAQHNDVKVIDVDEHRVNSINLRQSTVSDVDIEKFLKNDELSLLATQDEGIAYKDADFIIVATPTNYDKDSNRFDTTSVDSVVESSLKMNKNCLVIIKSTIPVGHTKHLQTLLNSNRVIFSPEFLREGSALRDNLFPSRVVIGGNCDKSKAFSRVMVRSAKSKNVNTLFTSSTEAEAIKLFANTFLAMRVSFFNELDSYALSNGLNTKKIIEGVCLDDRIGDGYNNPSFGYGGYCLPKDTKQLLANYKYVPQTLIQAIVSSNKIRKDFIAKEILKHNPKIVGFFRLVMKEGSDNFRSSAIQGIMKRIKDQCVDVVVYEPKLNKKEFFGAKVISDLNDFKELSDLIVVNRKTESLSDVDYKCFSRDIYNEN